MASLKQNDLFGGLCCPFLPAWFVHRWMASGFLSLERIKAHESSSSGPEGAGKLDSTQSCSFWMNLSTPLKHMRHQQWTPSLSSCPPGLPPAVAPAPCFCAWTAASPYQNNSLLPSELLWALLYSDDTGRGSDLRPSQAFPLLRLCLLPPSRVKVLI